MKVSVVIPVFNKAAHVREAVESILQGTWTDLELIAVDDRSTDGSLDVLRSITDPRLRIIALERNLGPAGAMNAGIDACRGEYIARLDADDIAVPDRLALQVAFMDAQPHIGASSGHLMLMGDQRGTWKFPLTPEACRARILFTTPIVQGACILRRSVIEEHGIRYDPEWPRVGEDWLLWTRLLQVTEMANVDAVLLHYRRGSDNISRTSDHAQHRALVARIFRAWGIELNEDDARSHLLVQRKFQQAPTAADVMAVRTWLDTLLRMNGKRALFPQEAFRAQVEQAWNELFHYLPPFGVRVAMAHLRIPSAERWGHAIYLAKYRSRQLFGGSTTAR